MVTRGDYVIYLLIAIFIILLGSFLYKGYQNTKSAAIHSIKLKNSSSNQPALRVLHISDMHLEHISITPEQLYADLKDEPIDLIALTGDYLDRKRTIPKLVLYLETLNRLKPAYGAYAVFGNHDYVLRGKHFEQLKAVLNNHGFQPMQNEHICIEINGRRLNIIGIDDYSTNRSDFKKSYQHIKNGFNLVLTHDPNIVLAMQDYHFDYLLSGHFHGGQIHWPKPYHLVKMGKLVRMNMVKGLHYYKGRPFYISEGLGQTGVNIRIGSRPEITLHELSLDTEANRQNKTIAG